MDRPGERARVVGGTDSCPMASRTRVSALWGTRPAIPGVDRCRLSGRIGALVLPGMRLDARTLWLIAENFADGEASVETADEARVNRHTTDRLFRLLRAAIYRTRPTKPIVLPWVLRPQDAGGPEDVAEFDEVYITAGLKGGAGGLSLEREPRKRGLKRRGRGTWDSDRLPVFGLLCREGQVRLFVLRNVQTETIRPIVHQMVQRGARVYTDGYGPSGCP